ncbi:MAG: hypothetical protein ABS44_10030 [Chryseobacterium sp. SCN 40-13]|nr:MAG: hypothetical protein ABS44_10030 [Chryseobacterium sp. SCN 40-13]
MEKFNLIIMRKNLLLLLFFTIISCNTDRYDTFNYEHNNSLGNVDSKTMKGSLQLDLTPYILAEEEFTNVMQSLEGIKDEIEDNEEVVREILNPLLINGQQIHSEIIDFLERSGELENLTIEEQNEIIYLNDEQLVELSYIMYNQQQYASDANNIDWPRVFNCASAAIGISKIKELYTASFSLGGATIQTYTGALKVIGKRYLGYVGLAIMIYEFTTCVYG